MLPRTAVVASCFLLGLVGTAQAELVQRGNLFVHFDGGITPQKLPRHALAPIAVRIEGAVRVLGGEDPPALRRIRVALNRAGRLSTRGLPVCGRRRVELATSAEALAACGSTLVGSGGIVGRSTLPDQSPTTVRGDVLLFNSRAHGRPAILAHVYQVRPVPVVRTIVFEIRRTRGTFGTVLTARIMPGIERNGYLTSIFLQLGRRYVTRGQERTYLGAACTAPPGFPGATFPFARASMAFRGGRTLSSILVRSCVVRGS